MSKVLFFAALFFSNISFSHDFFFGFAELRYNEQDSIYELIMSSDAHDVEDALNNDGIEIKELEDHYDDEEMKVKINYFLMVGFEFKDKNKVFRFELIGYEVSKDGVVNFYLKSGKCKPLTNYELTFDWMMDLFPKQQNKLTHFHDTTYSVATFVQSKRTATIQF
jgi:hypothetical protein